MNGERDDPKGQLGHLARGDGADDHECDEAE